MRRGLGRLIWTWLSAVGSLLALLMAGGAFSTAAAQYTLCNKTSYVLSAAIGYDDAETSSRLTRGWWNLRPGECKRALSDPIDPGTYYVYAEAIPGHQGELRTWSGPRQLCVQNDSIFTLRDQSVCQGDPIRQRSFKAVVVPDTTDGTYQTEFSDEKNYSVYAAEVAGVQRLLRDVDMFSGRIDGEIGNATRQAIRRYQQSKGISRTGTIDDDLIDSLIRDANLAETQLGFLFCNNTMLPVWAAFAQPQDESDIYRSSGWWRIETQKCVKVRRGEVKGEKYYVYGVMEDDSRSVPLAGGTREFCVDSVQFDAEDGANCATSGYQSASFLEVVPEEDGRVIFEFKPELFNPDLVGQ